MFAKDRNNEEKRYWYCSIDGEYMRKMIRSFLVLGGVVLAAAMVYMLVTPVTPSELIYFFIGFGAVMLIILAVCGLADQEQIPGSLFHDGRLYLLRKRQIRKTRLLQGCILRRGGIRQNKASHKIHQAPDLYSGCGI